MAPGAAHPRLQELETWQPRVVERHVVGAPHASRGQGSHPEVVERGHPGLEDRPDVLVLLEPDAPVAAGAVVLIEVHGEVVVVGFHPHLRIAGIAEVPLHVGPRPENALFLA